MALRVSVVCDKDHLYHGVLKNVACVDMYRGDLEVLELSIQIKQETMLLLSKKEIKTPFPEKGGFI